MLEQLHHYYDTFSLSHLLTSNNMSQKMNILVIHGYVQTAAIVAANTARLRADLAPIADLYYVDGPALAGEERRSDRARPWWWLGNQLKLREGSERRWHDTVEWWSDHLSRNQYDGIIGLSQGSAMTALLVSMLADPRQVPEFNPRLPQKIQFAILCSGFVSHASPHGDIYSVPDDLPSLHTVDDNDYIVPAARTVELREKFKTYIILKHDEGHNIPVRGDWPALFRDFILNATKGRAS